MNGEQHQAHVRELAEGAAEAARADYSGPEAKARKMRQLIHQAAAEGEGRGYDRRRAEERAGSAAVDWETFTMMLGEGFATAFRKTGGGYNLAIWKLIQSMRPEDWREVVRFVADPLWAALRDSTPREER